MARAEWPTFKIGDRVEWDSQANRGQWTKIGTVLAIVPANELPLRVFDPIERETGYSSTFDPRTLVRNHESYVVAVDQIGKVRKRKPVLYYPRVTALRKIES